MKVNFPITSFGLLLLIFLAVNSFGQSESSSGACKAKFIYAYETNGEVKFEAIVSSGTNIFEWDFGDGQSLNATTSKVSHRYVRAGVYEACLKTTDSSGCQKRVCKQVVPSFAGPCDAGFVIVKDALKVDFYALSASSDSYSWNFGDGDSGTGRQISHSYSSTGQWTVQLIVSDNSAKCADTSLVTIYLNGMNCTADYTYQKDSTGGVRFTSTSTPSGMQHFWSFGDGRTSIFPNPVHQYRTAGIFNVHLIVQDTASSCSDTILKQISISPPPRFDVRGRVTAGGAYATDGMVYLYEVDSLQNFYHPVDTVKISGSPITGEYRFRNVGIGNYLIKAVLGPRDAQFGKFLPSYAGSQKLYWNMNSSMRIYSGGTNAYNIDLIPGIGTFGPGAIKGKVYDAAATPGIGSEEVPLLLLDAQQNPVATTLSDSNGLYEFKDVAYGVYMLTIDWPGAKQVYKVVILSPNRPISTGNNFIAGSGSVVLSEEEISIEELYLYPNPVQDRLMIGTGSFDRQLLSIQILGTDGKVVFQRLEALYGQENIELDLSTLPDGLYLLRASSGSRTSVGKFIKY